MNKKSIYPLNNPSISHILAIDYGRSKVGLALADRETKIAFAYATLANDKNFLEKIKEIIEKELVDRIIIGISFYINGESLKNEEERMGKLIKDTFPDMKIEYQNEMFTTKIAEINLAEKGIKKIKKYDDQEAARIILQEWLNNVKM